MQYQTHYCNRLQSESPRIGIRPVVDGRRGGIRESLEDVTMDMAKRTARLLTERLRHSNGSLVECVMADTCIGGVAEAARTEEKFSRRMSVLPFR